MIPALLIGAAAQSAWTTYLCYMGEAMVAGGAFAYRHELYQGAIDLLFTTHSYQNEHEVLLQNIADELNIQHQAPVNQAQTLNQTTHTHIETLDSQTRIRQISLDETLVHLDNMVERTAAIASTLDTLIPITHQLAKETQNTIDTIKISLHQLINDLSQTRDKIQASQQGLSRIEQDFSITVERLAQWEQRLSSSCQMGQQIINLSTIEHQTRQMLVSQDADKNTEIQQLKQEREALIALTRQQQALLLELTIENDDLQNRLIDKPSQAIDEQFCAESKSNTSYRLFKA